jgi:Arc/MetJ-type ribon-helix-helix transcriptional regulator
MYVNLHLSGELERFINELIDKGLAANKTEAIRLSITRYYEEWAIKRKVEKDQLNQSTIDLAWNNPSDEKASEFYKKRYL